MSRTNNINLKQFLWVLKRMHSPQSERGAEIETANLPCMWIARR